MRSMMYKAAITVMCLLAMVALYFATDLVMGFRIFAVIVIAITLGSYIID